MRSWHPTLSSHLMYDHRKYILQILLYYVYTYIIMLGDDYGKYTIKKKVSIKYAKLKFRSESETKIQQKKKICEIKAFI